MEQSKFFKLKGKVQHYQWGGFTYLPQLLSLNNDQQQPFAEYWLGAHVQAPAELDNGSKLDSAVAAHPEWLGARVQDAFGRLPYLLKVLDVKDMLSIQVHPSRESALKGFREENEAGVPLSASNRNYKDDNHKPELMAALGDFWLLHGFRNITSMQSILAAKPELNFLLPVFGEGNYEALYRTVMEMPADEVKGRLDPLLERIIPLYQQGSLDRSNPDFWAARAAITFNQPGQVDRGIFSVYLLNLVQMKRGEAIFQDAGILHAYLEGQNVELMANSDNVLRGGLTPKHIDVPELMKHVRFEPVEPNILAGSAMNEKETAYVTPAKDFELRRIDLEAGEHYSLKAETLDILLVLNGKVLANSGARTVDVEKGAALLLAAGAELRLESATGAEIYHATVPA
ncbi:mannose-6-phosphate isomerase, class I [Flavihumibacter rivuli]|uniref:mannose-6-phosphate isomerase, class I n=1 Tax=Flavihumibacter rivuli TaxID=2838156 RepID=UPI001BDF4967|nr:mannose-6-phosphate isomerase, class I [Flavihumibacter rivuli]ULQ56892.1 mannose-6-phosphate isomerase, class I [Flavihumibacter rivuli]